ncbi:MAG: serine hydroxymethyltransferase [Pseudomonadota bacterium]
MPKGDVYFEHVAISSYAKCSAIDPETGTEVSVMGPVSARPRDLEKLALAKLRRRLKEKAF